MYYAGRQLGTAESCVNYLYGRVCLYLITNESYYSDVCMRRSDDRQYNKLRVHGNMAEQPSKNLRYRQYREQPK